MNKNISIIIWVLLQIALLSAQDLHLIHPYQLAISNSTSRLSKPEFSGSALSQAFFRDNYDMDFTLFLPFHGLTDADLRTSTFELISPSFEWGGISLVYSNFNVENLNDKVFNSQSVQIGYSNFVFNRIIFSILQKWNQYSWYSQNYENSTVNGYALAFNMIYILNGYNSIGLSVDNLFASTYSSVDDDNPGRIIRFSYVNNFKNSDFDVEGGLSVKEDDLYNKNFGAFINTDIQLSKKFSLAAEYAHQFYNEVGIGLKYSFSTEFMQAQLIYGFRIDDSPLPLTTFKQAFGLSIQLKQFHYENTRVNPQIVYRDQKSPGVQLSRLSNFTVFINDDDSDFLKLQVAAKDDLSGVAEIAMDIVPEADSSNVLFNISHAVIGLNIKDTLTFNGYNYSGQFLQNDIYQARINATDIAGNKSKTRFLPFRVLSRRNDSLGPDIKIEFDTTAITVKPDQMDWLLNANITIDEQSESAVRWTIHLFKTTDDSIWTGLKPVNGAAEVYNHNFQWLLRKKRSSNINGKYKIKVEAYDELNNYSSYWSGVKTIIDTVLLSEREQVKPVDVAETNHPEPAVVYIPQAEDNVPVEAVKRILLPATVSYNNREVTLTDFKFNQNQVFNISDNQQSLSVIGLYLQDLTNSKLTVEYSDLLQNIPHFEMDLKDFFREAFGIATDRIKLVVSNKRHIHFIITK